MKRFGILAVVLAATACQPAAERQASAKREVSIVTDAVLVRQNSSKTKQDAVQTLLLGEWSCNAITDGINVTMSIDFQPNGIMQAGMHMVSDQLDIKADAEGKWVLTGFNLKQSFTSLGDFTGTLNGAPVTPQISASLKASILEMATEPEAMNISDHKFTLTDGQGVVTTCTQ